MKKLSFAYKGGRAVREMDAAMKPLGFCMEKGDYVKTGGEAAGKLSRIRLLTGPMIVDVDILPGDDLENTLEDMQNAGLIEK